MATERQVIIVEIPHQRSATAYLTSEGDLRRRAEIKSERSGEDYAELTLKELEADYGVDNVPTTAREIAENCGRVLEMNGKFYDPTAAFPSYAYWVREVLFRDLHSWYEFETLEEAKVWAAKYQGHQWTAVRAAVEAL